MKPHVARALRGSDRPVQRDGSGNALCRECGGAVRRPRRTFCSQVCVDVLLIRTSPSAARDRVFERDGGRCARCGLDTEALKRRVTALRRKKPSPEVIESARRLAFGFERAVTIRRSRPRIAVLRAFWEADHIVPVIEGGGGCGLENLRTLCIPCHHSETCELARRRAVARRSAERIEPEPKIGNREWEIEGT